MAINKSVYLTFPFHLTNAIEGLVTFCRFKLCHPYCLSVFDLFFLCKNLIFSCFDDLNVSEEQPLKFSFRRLSIFHDPVI